MVFGNGGDGGVIFGSGSTRAPGGDLDCNLWSGFIMDSTAKQLLVWPGEGTKL